MIYSIIVACTASLLYCVPIPVLTRGFSDPDVCRAWVEAKESELTGRNPPLKGTERDARRRYPVVLGKCQHFYK